MSSISEFIKYCRMLKVPINNAIGAYLPLAGGTMSGDLILNADATQALQAVTLRQLQDAIAGITPENAVIAASISNVSGTYNNGASGVGATFTLTATGVLMLDGVTITVGQRVLLKNQTTSFQNGIYVATNPGSIGVSAILTRATDYDSPSDITAFNLTPVVGGGQVGTTWLQVALVTSVGVSSITYTLFSGGAVSITLQQAYDAGNEILLSSGTPLEISAPGSVFSFENIPGAPYFQKAASTTQGTIPVPLMTSTEFDAILSKTQGIKAYATDLGRDVVYNGAVRQDVAFLSDIAAIQEDASYGEMYFTGNVTPTTIVTQGVPVQVNATYLSGILLNFTQVAGVLTYTGTAAQTMLVIATVTATYNAASNNTTFMLVKNGSVITKSKQSTFIGGITPAAQPNPVKSLVSLATGDTLALWVQNDDSTDDPIIQDVNFTANNFGGVDVQNLASAGAFPWTPVPGDTSGATSINFLFGSYIRCGDYVHATFKLEFTATSLLPVIAFTAPFVAPGAFTTFFQSAIAVAISPQGTTATYSDPLDCGNLSATDTLYIGLKVATLTAPNNVYTLNVNLSYKFQNF